MRILAVDDLAANLYLLETILRAAGYEVVSASNGAKALESAREKPPDLVIADILMPVMDGFELCRRWKADDRLRSIPFIFYTATYTDAKDEAFALSLGAERFLVKPMKLEELVEVVREVLEASRATTGPPVQRSPGAESEALQQHNAVLLRKLEQKVAQLEEQIAQRKRAERLLRTISEVNQLIVRARDRETLLGEACRALVTHGGFLMAWIGFATPGAPFVVPAARAGAWPDFVDGLVVRTDETPEGSGPIGTAIRTGQRAVVADVAADPSVAPWRDGMLACGFRAVAAFPLRAQGGPAGALAVHAAEAIELGGEEAELLDELAGDLGHALDAIENREERARLSDQLRRSEALHRSVIENATDLILLIEADATVRFASPSLRESLGYEVDEVQGSNLFAYFDPEAVEEARRDFAAGVRDEFPTLPEKLRIRGKNGRIRTFEYVAVNLLENPAVHGIVAVCRDVTERLALEEKLRQAQKMEAFGQLAGGVAHDFNNLLMVIGGYGQDLADRLPPGDPSRPDLEQILRAAERAAALTRQLLAFSRKQVVTPTVLPLRDVVVNTEKMLRRLIGEDIRLIGSHAPAPWNVKADPGQLEQVLLNLAVNARDAMPGGGTLFLETANVELRQPLAHFHGTLPEGSYATMTVRDTGSGMSAETMHRLFEPFFTTKAPGKGTGLGLATVYGIVKQSGGDFVVSSEPGRGSTFTVYLPRALEPPVPREPVTAVASVGGGETLLVVEDEAGVRRFLVRVLSGAGYSVLEATNGREASALLSAKTQRIDLVIADVVMPEMGGRELVRRVSESRPSAPVLLMSGYPDPPGASPGEIDPTRFLQKPFQPATLLEKVRELLGRTEGR